MKKSLIMLVVPAVLYGPIAFLLMVSSSLYRPNCVKYYNDDQYYETISLTITEINQYDDNIVIRGNHNNINFDDGFIILGNNTNIMISKNYQDNLIIGEKVEIIASPGYFGDGWLYPIASLKHEDKEYLNYDIAKDNIVMYYQNQSNDNKVFFITSVVLVITVHITLVIGFISYIIKYIKINKNKNNQGEVW